MNPIRFLGFVAALLAFSAGSAQAQDGKFAFGPQAGYVFSDYSVESSPFGNNFDNENGFMAGLFFEFGVWTVTLRPEVNYVEKGYTLANTAEVTHKYIEVPVLLKVNPFGDAAFSPFLLLGPSWSHHLESDVTLLNASSTYRDTADDWDISGVAGLGLEFNVAENLALNAQGRYNFGFRDLDETAAEVRSRGIYLLGGLSFQY